MITLPPIPGLKNPENETKLGLTRNSHLVKYEETLVYI
jgi:hypothetical protein